MTNTLENLNAALVVVAIYAGVWGLLKVWDWVRGR